MGHCWVCICGRYILCVADSGIGVVVLISIGVEFALLIWYLWYCMYQQQYCWIRYWYYFDISHIFGIEIVLCIGDCDSDVALVGTLFPSLMLLFCYRLFTNLGVGIAFRG